MTVTVKDICNMFNVTRDKVQQQGSKQLFIVDLLQTRVLVSYKTIVGRFINTTWYLTTCKYSRTTTTQVNQFARTTPFDVVWAVT